MGGASFIRDASQLPFWFKLERYTEISTNDDLHLQIVYRVRLLNLIRRSHLLKSEIYLSSLYKSKEELSQLDQSWMNEVDEVIYNEIIQDTFMFEIFTILDTKDAVIPLREVNMHNLCSIANLADDEYRENFQKQRSPLADKENANDTNEGLIRFKKNEKRDFDTVADFRKNLFENSRFHMLEIDLRAPDTLLKTRFEEWLQVERQKEDNKNIAIREGLLLRKKIISYRLLPYIDLAILWATIKGKRISPTLLERTLFPDGNTPTNFVKTISTLAEELLNPNSSAYLQLIVK